MIDRSATYATMSFKARKSSKDGTDMRMPAPYVLAKNHPFRTNEDDCYNQASGTTPIMQSWFRFDEFIFVKKPFQPSFTSIQLNIK